MHTTNNRLNGQHAQPTAVRQQPPARRKRRLPKADRLMYWAATAAPWGLAILLLAVSMPHLASGFQDICHCGALAGWLLAIAIDSAQVIAKLQLTMTKQYTVTTAGKWSATGIVAGTSLMSMALNVLAFLSGAENTTGTVLAWVAGIMLPLLILALSYTGSCYALAKKTTKTSSRRKKSK